MNMSYTEEPKVKKWQQRLTAQSCTVASLSPLQLLHKPNGELLFGLFEADVRDREGTRFPKYVCIRGDACIIVPLVIHARTGQQRFVMIRQPRIGSGKHSLEFPAGMLDRHADDPLFVAQKELTEETGLTVPQEYFSPLWDKELYSSVGLLDEGIHYFGCQLVGDDALFTRLEGSRCGAQDEEEHIRVTLQSREEALKEASTTQTLLGLSLYEQARVNIPHYQYPPDTTCA
jgi:8-oxo-dGTP pyrophosphatase MutT (NUDIX family)